MMQVLLFTRVPYATRPFHADREPVKPRGSGPRSASGATAGPAGLSADVGKPAIFGAAHATPLTSPSRRGALFSLSMRKILVVEDSASTRAFVRSTLESSGPDVEVSEATSGFDALRLLPRGPYALVVSDINMPDINGLELVQFMRKSELHRNTPILLISTQSSDRDRQRGLRLGANGYLAKPFSGKALVDEVRRHLIDDAARNEEPRG